MKSFLLGLFGAVVGFALCFFLVKGNTGNSNSASDNRFSLFSEPGEVLAMKSFRVFRVSDNGYALAESSEKAQVQWAIEYGDPIVLLVPEEGVSYYDDQVIKVPQGKVARQIGIYRYETQSEDVKTVPVVRILDK